MKLMQCLILIGLLALGSYIIMVEPAFIFSSVRDTWHQLSDESRKARACVQRWKRAGTVFMLLFLLLGCHPAFALMVIWGSI